MEEAYEKLKREGKTDVDSLVTWIKESNIIDDTQADEDRVRKLFDDVPDNKNIDLTTFTSIVNKIANDKKQNIQDVIKLLMAKVDDVKKMVRGVVAETMAGAVAGARAAAFDALKGLKE